MPRNTVDVLISGGGVAGLTAAAAFGVSGFSVLCVDPSTPIVDRNSKGADLRTTAFLQPSCNILKTIGLWDRLAPYATALQIMRIVDHGGKTSDERIVKEFDAAEISEDPFGWNLPNWLLRREMLAHISELENVTFCSGVKTTSVLTREGEAIVSLSSGERFSAKLLVAADGRNSPVREQVGISTKTLRYGQKALAFAATHPIPHENVSTEIHRSGGPFTFVPLPDHNGHPSSAVVWMERGPETKRLSHLPVDDFEAEMTDRSGHLFGPLKLASRITVWPIISQIAERFSAQRTALIAEAAHVVPPIGAQGLNMSLADISTLLNLAKTDPDDLGSTKMLDQYHRLRWPDAKLRVTGIDALNRASMAGGEIAKSLRAAGLNALHTAKPVRQTLMRAGLGVKSNVI